MSELTRRGSVLPTPDRAADEIREQGKVGKRNDRLRAALITALNGGTIRSAVAWDILHEWDKWVP
jgi:hypothetical protein